MRVNFFTIAEFSIPKNLTVLCAKSGSRAKVQLTSVLDESLRVPLRDELHLLLDPVKSYGLKKECSLRMHLQFVTKLWVKSLHGGKIYFLVRS